MISILTGDIVGSQDLNAEQRSQLPSILREAANYALVGESLEVFGGDSWQALCHPPQTALARAIIFRSYLLGTKGIDTRISIGIGAYESIRPQKISLSQGEAFVLSGQGLKNMPSDRRITLHPSDTLPPATTQLLDAATTLLDAISANWTAKQSQAVALDVSVFPQWNQLHQKDLAKKFTPPISAQAYGKHLASAQWKLVKQSLQSISLALHQTLPAPEPKS